ncbi:uncharacterized protein LOC144634192 [Oculina patagonica]
MINDLSPSDVQTWKYVDDTTLAEVIAKDSESNIQEAVDTVALWSRCNKLQLNVDKCKELTIDFKKIKQSFAPISINSLDLDLVNSVKILGVTITDTLHWNNHVTEIIKKANKRLYFIKLLKRACVPRKVILNFYCTCIRPVLEYCAPAFHHSLPAYLSDDIERVQKRALFIIDPQASYQDILSSCNLSTLKERRSILCKKLFNKIMLDSSHKLHKYIPQENVNMYNLRSQRHFQACKARTNRFKHSFFPSMSNF